MKEDFIIQRRNRLKKDYLITSHVLLYGYKMVSDGAKQTYQVIDSMDWEDQVTKDSKGYVFPAVETIAERRGKGISSVYRHIEELILNKLLSRIRRKNKPSILIIEDVSKEETENYVEKYMNKSTIKPQGEDKFRILKNEKSNTLNQFSKMGIAYKEEKNETKENEINVNENLPISEEKKRYGMQGLGDIMKRFDVVKTPAVKENKILKRTAVKQTPSRGVLNNSEIPARGHPKPEDKIKRDYYAEQISTELQDEKSLGCYRTIAEKVPQHVIFETLASVKETWKEGKIKKSRGALFVDIIKTYCEKKHIDLDFSQQNNTKNIYQRGVSL